MFNVATLIAILAAASTACSAALPHAGFETQASLTLNTSSTERSHPHQRARRDTSSCGSSTYYNPSVGTGACGWENADSEFVVALPYDYFNNSCGQSITITAAGRSVTAKIVDLCPSCEEGHVDMSPALFEQFAGLPQGRVDTCWSYEIAPLSP